MPFTVVTRPLIASAAAAALLLSVAACSSADTPTDPTTAPTPTTAGWVDVCEVPSGDAVASVSVSGEYGEPPVVDFPEGLSTDTTQRVALGEGDGRTVEENSLISMAYTIFAGSTGEVIEAQGYDELGPLPLVATTQMLPAFPMTFGCAEPGTRIVSVIAPSDAFGETGFGNDIEPGSEGDVDDRLIIAPNETLVIVMDVVRILDRAWGVDQPEVEGMPEVTLIANAEPIVTVPDAPAPTDLRVAVLKQGDGPVVVEGSQAIMQYKGVNWATNEEFDSSWARGDVAEFAIAQLVQGFQQAVIGQNQGSQVLVVMPPELAYGPKTGAAGEHALAGETLVFVIDILFAVGPDA